MDERVESILSEHGGAGISSVSLDTASNTITVNIQSEAPLPLAQMEAVRKGFSQIMAECEVDVKFSYDREAWNFGSTPERFVPLFREAWAFLFPVVRPAVMSTVWEMSGSSASVRINPTLFPALDSEGMLANVSLELKHAYGIDIRLNAEADESVPEPDVPRAEAYRSPVKKERKKRMSSSDIVIGREINAARCMKLKDLSEVYSVITVSGMILSIDVIERKNGAYVVTIVISDRTESIPLKVFADQKDKKVVDKLQKCFDEGKTLLVMGRYEHDDWLKRMCIFPSSINIIPTVLREDKAEKKRVELHLHTQMSSMDALIAPEDAVKTAARWGHRAVAITDHGVVQAFPHAVSTAKKLASKGQDIKVILGTEGYLLPDCEPADRDRGFVFVGSVACEGPHGPAVFELCALKDSGEHMEITVDPGIPLSERQRSELGLTEEEILAGDSLPDAAKKLSEFASGRNMVIFSRELFESVFARSVRYCVDVSALMRYLERVDMPRVAHTLESLAAERELPCTRALEKAQLIRVLFEEVLSGIDRRGAVLPLFDYSRTQRVKGKRLTNHIILLAKNKAGLKNLYTMVSFAHLDHFKKVPVIPKSLLYLYREDIIVGSACEAGELFRAVLDEESEETVEKIASLYDYFEIQPIGNNAFLIREGKVENAEGLRRLNCRILALGERLNKPVVATGDVHFMEPDDSIMRAVIMNAKDFKDAEQQAPLYFRTTDDMLDEFSYLGEEEALRVVVENPNSIADMCESMAPFLDEQRTYSPTFEGANQELTEMAMKRAHEIYGDELPEIVAARLKKELDSILGNGYASLYLVAQRLVTKSNSDGYIVGSRGSVGSSLVAYMAGITEVNALPPHFVCKKCRHSEFDINRELFSCGVDMPDKDCPVCGERMEKLGYDIPFEVFLGFKGDKTPDIDLNFSGEYQPIAHKFTEIMFGEGHAFRAGTISGIKDKTAYGYVKKYCEDAGASFSRDEQTRIVKGCEGIKRTTGQHPGGIIIVPEDLDILEFTPIQHPADKSELNIITTHFDFHALDDRLVKLDILGHDDPTALRMLQDITGLDPHDIPLDDQETMALFSTQGPLGIDLSELGTDVGSVGIPEFGTGFVRQLLMDTRPTTMEELVRISGLSHGTDVWVGNAQELIKSGTATLSGVICCRDDIMNYLISQGCESAISFKTMESVRKGRGLTPQMEDAMKASKVARWFVDSCKKIKYLFPRAHAAAYVMMAFRVAYYKVHYPEAFYAVYYTVRADAFDITLATGGAGKVLNNIKMLKRKSEKEKEEKDADLITILEVVYEMNLRGIELLPVDLYRSHATQFIVEGKTLLPPFSAVPGVGGNAAESVAAAAKGRKFTSVEEFRVLSRANTAVVEALRLSGCFAGLPETDQVTLF